MKIRYAIVDDEPIAHSIIEEFAKSLVALEKVGNCYDAFEALQLLRREQVDLLFLDLNMPRLSGFAFLATLSLPPKTIITTAYQEFALEGYEHGVVDYLLKPFSLERFVRAVNRVIESEDPVGLPKASGAEFITVKMEKKHFRVRLSDILYVEAAGNYCKVITLNQTLVTLRKISDFEQALPAGFVRVHNSFIVAREKIDATDSNRVYVGEHEIPVGKTYQSVLRKL